MTNPQYREKLLFLLLLPLTLLGWLIANVKQKYIQLTIFSALVIYQIYFPILGDLDTTLLFIALLAFFAFGFMNKSLKYWVKQPIFLIYVIYMIPSFVSIIYSPDKVEGSKMIILSFVGLLATATGITFGRKYHVATVLNSIILMGIPLAIANIIFFVFPELEITFLKSKIARIFIEPNTLNNLFSESSNNILDPNKAGTLFVNTNVASVFFGILTWTAISLKMYYKNNNYSALVVLYLLAMLATNSRSGLIALVISVFTVIFLNITKKRTWSKIFFFGIPITMAFLWFLSTDLFNNITERLTLSAILSDPRIVIWKYAFNNVENPILGLGFGGWESISIYMEQYYRNFPAHNIFIISWLNTGIFGLIGLIVLLFGTLRLGIYNFKKTQITLTYALIGSFIYIIIQGMFDNFFLNDYRISSLAFFLSGLILAKQSLLKTRNN